MNEQWAQLDAAAARHIAQGRFMEAATMLRQSTVIRPDHADGWYNLGYVLRQMRAYPDALEAYARALECGVSGAEAVHVNRALILSEYMEQTVEAERELRAAIAVNPRFVPAWLNLGGLMEDVGNAEAAADAYREASRLAPGNGRAGARLAALRVNSGETDAALRDLEDRLRAGADSQDDQAELMFAYGNALDAVGRFPEAFAVITQANQMNSALRPPTQRYDRVAQERLVDALIDVFAKPRARDLCAHDSKMLFICGMFRSGSTVFEQLLGGHPQVQVGGELELIPAFVHEHLMPYPGAIRSLAEDDIAKLRQAYLQSIETNFPAAEHVTDKRPDNFLHIGLIKTLFPGARIVHTVRNILDNIVSIHFLHFAESINYSDRLSDIVHYIGQYRRLMLHWQSIYGDDIITVEYDALVQQPETVMAAAFARLGLPAIETSGAKNGPAPIIRTPSNWKARSTLHRKSSGRWQNYAAELEPIRAAVAQLDEESNK